MLYTLVDFRYVTHFILGLLQYMTDTTEMCVLSTKIVCLRVKFGNRFVMKGRGAYMIYILGIYACMVFPFKQN